uniref:Uncharacterized protein n=1 Tax=Anguilla anguilla TaxID=7936 RepID=A0A0E9QM47_ANGAN
MMIHTVPRHTCFYSPVTFITIKTPVITTILLHITGFSCKMSSNNHVGPFPTTRASFQ